MKKKELIDAVASGSKLTKADAGRLINQTNDFYDSLIAQYGFSNALAIKVIKQIVTAKSDGSKLTKADAGRTTKSTKADAG
jgi:hypothetical protein